MTYLDYLEQKVLLERLVIGLEEPVLIKGLGELSAKIDSGNGGYNVIHGTDFHQQGSELMFTTVDGSGNEKKIQSKIIDTIDINMGGGNIESRPVIELDIKFAGEDYKKIPFSVSDRSTNTNPILISKGFVEKELEALIDVGAMNISHEGIDVVYGEGYELNEGFLNSVKTVLNGAKTVNDKILSGLQKTNDFLKGGDNVNILSPVVSTLAGIAKIITSGDNLVKTDLKLIRNKLPNLVLPNKLKKLGYDVEKTIWENYNEIDFNKTTIIPFVSFTGKIGDITKGTSIKGLEKRIENWKSAIKQAKKQVSSSKEQNQPNEEQEEISDNQDKNVQHDLDDIEETTTDFKELNNFVLYFIPSFKSEDKNYSGTDIKAIFDKLLSSGKVNDLALKLFNIGNINKDSINSVLKVFVKFLNDINYNENSEKMYSGLFALATGDINNRQVHLYDNPNEAVCFNKRDKFKDVDIDSDKVGDLKNTNKKLNNLFPDLKEKIDSLNGKNKINTAINLIKSDDYEKILNFINNDQKDDLITLNTIKRNILLRNPDYIKLIFKLLGGILQTALIKGFLNDNEIGKKLLQHISGNFKEWKDFVDYCTANQEIQGILTEENEEDIWINKKLILFKQKGII